MHEHHPLVSEFLKVPLRTAIFPLTRKVNPSGLVMQIHSSANSATLSCKPLVLGKIVSKPRQKHSLAFQRLGPFQEIWRFRSLTLLPTSTYLSHLTTISWLYQRWAEVQILCRSISHTLFQRIIKVLVSQSPIATLAEPIVVGFSTDRRQNDSSLTPHQGSLPNHMRTI